jgi:UDP-N-acetylenolpyruvoylglucosamine reductase
MQNKVKNEFNVKLELEVKIIGERNWCKKFHIS